ncbi:MAG: oligosaccharide flippase family protein [Polyangiaceae bacterium]|nr:oligosaccharide flippase family protein [Polyangiaceae bacterium]
MAEAEDRSLLRNSLWRLAQVLGGGGLSAIFLFIYTAALDKADYGIYGVALSVAYLFEMFGAFGLRQTVSRFVAKERGAGDQGRLRAYARSALRLAAGFATLSGLLYGITMWLFRSSFGDWATVLLVLVGLRIMAKSVTFVLQGTLEGSGHFRRVSATALSIDLTQLAVILAVLPGGLSIVKVFVIETTLAALGTTTFLVQVYRKVLRSWQKVEGEPDLSRETFWFGLPLMLNGLAGFLYGRVDMLFVHAYLTKEEAADYYLMFRLFDFPLIALGAYVLVLSADMAHALGKGQSQRISSLFWRSTGMGAMFGLGLASLYFASTFVLPFLLPEYSGAMVLMRIAAPLLVVKCVAQVASGAFMVSLGRPAAMASLTALGGVVNVTLDLILVGPYRAPGLVYSTLIGHTVMGVLTFLFVLRGIRMLPAPPEVQPV